MEGLLDFVLRDILTRVGGVDRARAIVPAGMRTRPAPPLRESPRSNESESEDERIRSRSSLPSLALRRAGRDLRRRYDLVIQGTLRHYRKRIQLLGGPGNLRGGLVTVQHPRRNRDEMSALPQQRRIGILVLR